MWLNTGSGKPSSATGCEILQKHLFELHIYMEGSNSDFIFISKNNGVGFLNDSYSN